ncbi:hypothetical protein GQ44DRAFT_502236 [Phaeosphaeriaceae sp. PMI808]|nr:hypothetical protein GQ44DRAFT_502236 [Phaeosphaeriaceae sp. PMI808]
MKAQHIWRGITVTGAAWRSGRLVRVQMSAKDLPVRLGEAFSTTTNECPCKTSTTSTALDLTHSESRGPSCAMASSPRHLAARCIDPQLHGRMSRSLPTPFGRLAQCSPHRFCSLYRQPSSRGTLQRVSTCSWPKAVLTQRCAKIQQCPPNASNTRFALRRCLRW